MSSHLSHSIETIDAETIERPTPDEYEPDGAERTPSPVNVSPAAPCGECPACRLGGECDYLPF